MLGPVSGETVKRLSPATGLPKLAESAWLFRNLIKFFKEGTGGVQVRLGRTACLQIW
jgi:hypothetical protein